MFMTKEGYKQRFLEARKKAMSNGMRNTDYTFEMILALDEMARYDVWPDGRFGDDDCNVWSLLHRKYS